MAKLSFLGGVGTVTGSKYLVEHGESRVLVDCGLFQGLKEWREKNWEPPAFDPRSLDAVVLTHAHVDHTAYLPRLVALGYDRPVYCSRGTADLVKLLLPDSARLQDEEAAGVRLSLHIAGHILGSSLVLLELEGAGADGAGRRVLFSGDLGHYDQPIIKDPAPPPACDYLLVESTYGDRLHDPEKPKDALARIIADAVAKNGAVLIPAFAIGRTQELIYLIRELEDEKRIPILPVRVDSPMAAAATQVYSRRTEEQDEDYASILRQQRHPLRTHSMVTASSRDESKKLNDERGTRIIISASGMMTGGRVMHHAQRFLPDEKNTIIFVGYQAAGTLGRKIQDGAREVSIFKKMIPVRC